MINYLRVLQKSQGVFIISPFTKCYKATGKIGKLFKHAISENHAKAVTLNSIFLSGQNKPNSHTDYTTRPYYNNREFN